MTNRMKVKGIFVFLPLRATLKQFYLQTPFQTLAAIMLKHSNVVQWEKKKKKKWLSSKNTTQTPNSFCQVIIGKDCAAVSRPRVYCYIIPN